MKSLRSLGSPKKKTGVQPPKSDEGEKEEKRASSGDEEEKPKRFLRRKKNVDGKEESKKAASSSDEEPLKMKSKKKISDEEATSDDAKIKTKESGASRARKQLSRLKLLRGGNSGEKEKTSKDSSDESEDNQNPTKKEKPKSRDKSSNDSKEETPPENRAARRNRGEKSSDNVDNEESSEGDENNAKQLARLSPMRRTVLKKGNTKQRRDRMIAEKHPEVHVVGEIAYGCRFGQGAYSCKWSIDYGSAWTHVAGDQLGQTQTCYPSFGQDIVWSHPLDIHFATNSIQGWPRLLFQVWGMDDHGRTDLVGYGFLHVPSTPGYHEIEVSTWRPLGSSKEEVEAFFLGGTIQLLNDELLFNKAWSERCRLQTMSSGKIKVELDVLVRNFTDQDISL